MNKPSRDDRKQILGNEATPDPGRERDVDFDRMDHDHSPSRIEHTIGMLLSAPEPGQREDAISTLATNLPIPDEALAALALVAFRRDDVFIRRSCLGALQEANPSVSAAFTILLSYDRDSEFRSQIFDELTLRYPTLARTRLEEVCLTDDSLPTREDAFRLYIHSNREAAIAFRKTLSEDDELQRELKQRTQGILKLSLEPYATYPLPLPNDALTLITDTHTAVYSSDPEYQLRALRSLIDTNRSLATCVLAVCCLDEKAEVRAHARRQLELINSNCFTLLRDSLP